VLFPAKIKTTDERRVRIASLAGPSQLAVDAHLGGPDASSLAGGRFPF
jgi:hypothetical protein